MQGNLTLQNKIVLHVCHLLDDSGMGGITAHNTASGSGGAVNIQMFGVATSLITSAGAHAPAIDWNFAEHIIAGVAP